jgi:hypothetical protein
VNPICTVSKVRNARSAKLEIFIIHSKAGAGMRFGRPLHDYAHESHVMSSGKQYHEISIPPRSHQGRSGNANASSHGALSQIPDRPYAMIVRERSSQSGDNPSTQSHMPLIPPDPLARREQQDLPRQTPSSTCTGTSAVARSEEGRTYSRTGHSPERKG